MTENADQGTTVNAGEGANVNVEAPAPAGGGQDSGGAQGGEPALKAEDTSVEESSK